ASQKLAQAAGTMADTPTALQLRLLQTIVEVAAEKNSTLVLPFPVELLRFLERATPGAPAQPSGAGQPAATAEPEPPPAEPEPPPAEPEPPPAEPDAPAPAE